MNLLLRKRFRERGQSSVEFVAYLPMLLLFITAVYFVGATPFLFLRAQNINYSQCIFLARQGPYWFRMPATDVGYDVANTPPANPSVALWGVASPGFGIARYPHAGETNCITIMSPAMSVLLGGGFFNAPGIRNEYYVAVSPFMNCGDASLCELIIRRDGTVHTDAFGY